MSGNHINIMGIIGVSQDMKGFHAGEKIKNKTFLAGAAMP